MPQSVQIVPKYSQPTNTIVVNNYTTVSDDGNEASTVEAYPYIVVGASGQGIDNKLVEVTSLKNLYSMFGTSNYKLYGQPFMNAEMILSQPNTKVWYMRPMPADAVYANSVVSIWYKADVDNKKFRIKITSKSLSDKKADGSTDAVMTKALSTRENFYKEAVKLDGTAVAGVYKDSEGYTQVPILAIPSIGRGVYGNNLGWRITTNEAYEKQYGLKMYTFECLDNSNGTTTSATYIGSFVSSNKINGANLINDVIVEKGVEKVPMDFHVYESNFEDLYDAYVEFLNELVEKDPTLDIDIPEMDGFDPFFGLQLATSKVKDTPADPYIKFTQELTAEIDTTASTYVADNYTKTDITILSEPAGTKLLNGHDGSFTVDKKNDLAGTKRQAAIDAAYIAAFSGSADPTILSAKRIPSNALFDANYSMPVKRALVKLAQFRYDAIAYLDVTIDDLTITDITAATKDLSSLETLSDELDTFNDYMTSYNIQSYLIKESTTGKRVQVTTPYFLAGLHPNHWRNNGYHTPMVGSDVAMLTGHIKNSITPNIEDYEKDLTEALYNARLNYFLCIGENQFVRQTQSTATVDVSDLMEENNVNTFLFLKREIDAEVRAGMYRFTSAEERAEFAQVIKAKYAYMVGNQVFSLDVVFKQSAYEFEHSIVHCYLSVKFRELTKAVITEIDINKRTTDDDQ